MSSEWAEALTIGDLLARDGGSIKTGPFGTTLKASEYADEGVPLISVREIGHGSFHIDSKTPKVSDATLARLPEYILRKGDVVFARKGGIERCALVGSRQSGWFLGSDGIRLRPPTTCDARFIAYSLQTTAVKEWLVQNSTGSTMASLNQATIGRLPIALPARYEQTKVADLLEALDDRITLLRETNATLEAIAQALFKSWFVDFDPVRAKAEGRQPEGMDATTAALFPDSFEESELGLVPKGWAEVRLGQLCTFQKGCSYKGDGLSDDQGAYMFNLGCFNAPRVYAFEKVKRYTGDFREKHRVVAGDLIIANTDMTQHRAILGRPLLVPEGMAPGFVSHHVFKAVITQKEDAGIKHFLFFCFLQSSFRERAVGYATGTTVLALPKDALEQHLIYVPSDELLKTFADCCEPVFSAVKANEEQAQTLTQLRDTLLPRLISGQLRLPEAERLVEEMAS